MHPKQTKINIQGGGGIQNNSMYKESIISAKGKAINELKIIAGWLGGETFFRSVSYKRCT